MPNLLAEETSPYLLQHRDNPVDWRPWGDEAREVARERDVPLLVSIGYSACHWCHVMERESFEDDATAAYMNEHFVPVKVDREERPDVDAIYMEAVQGMTGHGGWPLTAFCDPDGVPFHCGTYFPPQPRQGMPSFLQVMEAVAQAWVEQREAIRGAAGRTREQLGAIARIPPSAEEIDPGLVDDAVGALADRVDPVNGGFGGAPKFPPASALDLMLARGFTDPVELTLDAMAAGGIHDHLGGGFARYSVDARLAGSPLREDALRQRAARTLLPARVEGARPRALARGLQGDPRLGAGRDARPRGWLLLGARRRLRGRRGALLHLDPRGDRRGTRGRRPRAPGTCDQGPPRGGPGRAPRGPQRPAPSPRPGRGAAERLRRRSRGAPPRPLEADPPGLDDKRLLAWNALMAGALAEAGAALGEPRYVDAAVACVDFILGTMRDDGRLLRTYKDGRAHLNAYLEDHAYLLEALLDVYEATFDPRHYLAAREIADAMIERFGDEENGGFFTTSDGPRGADRPPQGPRRPSRSRRATRPPPAACSASRR